MPDVYKSAQFKTAQDLDAALNKAANIDTYVTAAANSATAAGNSATAAAGSATAATSSQTSAANSATAAQAEADRAEAALSDNNLKLAKVDKNLSDYMALMSQVNINQEAKQTVTGYDKVLSLSKNAANGNAGFNLKGLTANNIVTNGDFSNGTTGWIGVGSSFSVAGNTATITGSGTSLAPGTQQTTSIPYVEGKKIFMKSVNKVTNANCTKITFSARATGMEDASAIQVSSPTNGITYRNGGIITLGAGGSGFIQLYVRHYYADDATANGKVMTVQNVIAIDLTAIFGAGNEPDSATCDKMFANWFDSLQSTKSRGRVRSVGKNLFDGELESGYLNASTGLNVVDTTKIRSKNYQRINPSTSYIISLNGVGKTTNVFYYDANKSFISYGTMSAGTFTTPANCCYIRFYHTSTDISEKIQLELGTSATSYEPYKEALKYLNTTEPLRRVPNGTQDEIRQRSDGDYEFAQRCKEYTLQAIDFASLSTSSTNVDLVLSNVSFKSDAMLGSSTKAGRLFIPNYKEVDETGVDNTANIGGYYYNASGQLGVVVAKGTYVDLAAAQAALAGTKIIYQLATPVVTPIETSGTLLSYPSGSVYWEPITADAGVYNNGISVFATGFPISALTTLSKVDFTTGVETALNVSTAVIASGGLSFTHPSLTNDDVVFFTYQFKNDAPEGNKTVQYYDSRYVVKDSATGKFYQWGISVANAVPSIGLVEV